MSANTTIQEGGKGYPFGPVKCLMVEGDDGKYYPWYPEAERQLDSLNVDKNGIYLASKYGVYGWSRVSVNVPQTDSVTGRDPETGQEVTVRADPETGEIIETVIPSEIRVTTLPTKTTYTDGETINYTGIVVHGYSSTGQDIGEIPFSELVFPVTTAQGWDNQWTDGQGLNAMQIAYTPHWNRAEWVQIYPGRIDEEQVFVCGTALGTHEGHPATFGASSDGTPGTLFVTRYYEPGYGKYYNYMASMAGSRDCNLFDYYAGELADSGQRILTGWFLRGGTGASAGDKVFRMVSWEEFLTDIPVSTVDPTTVTPANLHATQSLPVQWSCTDSGAILETSFNITVTGGN